MTTASAISNFIADNSLIIGIVLIVIFIIMFKEQIINYFKVELNNKEENKKNKEKE